MRPLVAIAAARFRMLLQYRGAALGGLVTQIFFGLTRIMVFEGFYRSATVAPPMDFRQAVAYVWLGQATLTLIPWNTDPEIREQVRAGTVVYELCRPLDLYAVWYARAVAWRSAPMLLRLVPMFVIVILVLPAIGLGEFALTLPSGIGGGSAWLVALAGALLISAALTTIIHVGLLWTLGQEGVSVIFFSLVSFCGGLVFPIPLFPAWAQTVLMALPFSGPLDLPARLYTGVLAPADLLWVLGHQLGWTGVLAALGRWLLGRQMRRMVIQGG